MPALFDDECLGLEAANILLTLQIPIHLSDCSNQLLQNPIDESESQSRNQLGQNPNDESNSESRNQVQVRWAITRRRTAIALQNAGRAETEMETKPQVKDEDALNPITPLVVSPSVSHDNFNHFPEKVSKKKCLGESPKLSAEDQTGHTTGVSSLAVIWSASGTTSKRDLPEGSNNMARRMIDLEAVAFGTDPVPNETLAATRSAERSVVIAEQTAQGHGRVPLPLPSSTEKVSKWKRSNKGKDVVGSSAGQDSVEKWVPTFEHNGRPITTLDSVMESCDLAFDLSKALLLPLDMAEHDASTSDLMKEVTQLLVVCIQQLHVMDARRQTREEEYNRMTNLMAETELALKLVEAKLKQAELKAKEAKVAVAEKEKYAKEAKAKKRMAERRAADAEAALKRMKAKQAKLIEKSTQKGWDEAGEAYASKVLELRDKLYSKGWVDALHAIGTNKASPLFKDIPVPSKAALGEA
ncbi:hypothetical protein LOK49_LG08G00281 [Camellia lanceoleosa]|uniref:Uncharacterized protein n=1 Tax=Camellia lanceoleosa TaxID=1840588 RepID=A0ACC0GSV7_9ERIC|nr:hypothetical protein LOK49_LG08G00281 [Camellia lanceoleosa]